MFPRLHLCPFKGLSEEFRKIRGAQRVPVTTNIKAIKIVSFFTDGSLQSSCEGRKSFSGEHAPNNPEDHLIPLRRSIIKARFRTLLFTCYYQQPCRASKVDGECSAEQTERCGVTNVFGYNWNRLLPGQWDEQLASYVECLSCPPIEDIDIRLARSLVLILSIHLLLLGSVYSVADNCCESPETNSTTLFPYQPAFTMTSTTVFCTSFVAKEMCWPLGFLVTRLSNFTAL